MKNFTEVGMGIFILNEIHVILYGVGEVEKEKNIENIILYMNLEEVMKIERLP